MKDRGEVADRVAEAMRARGVGVNELDRRLGRSEGYTSRLLSDRRAPRTDTLRRIAEVLSLSPAWLLEGIGPMDAATSKAPRYPHLETAIAYHGPDRWSSAVLAAAREIRLDADEDPPPAWWSETLDRIEKAIGGLKIGTPVAVDRTEEARRSRGGTRGSSK